MKKQLSLLACLLLAATSTAMAQIYADPVLTKPRADVQNWKRYTVDDEHFSVTLPNLPAMTTTVFTERALNKTRRERMLGAYADGVVYGVWVYENITRQSLKDFFGKQNRYNEWDDSSETAITLKGVNGKQYWAPDKRAIAQFFSNEGRLYKFVAGGDVDAADTVKHFFSSIVLGKNADGIEVEDGVGATPEDEWRNPVIAEKPVTRKVRLFQKPEPRYTEQARQEQITGTVVIKAVFSSSGTVKNIQVVKELPAGLTDRAIEAAKKIKFCPAVKDGKYVSMWLQLEYNFNLY